jgi:alpha-ketoglutarate-dependent taurine dioxygenase
MIREIKFSVDNFKVVAEAIERVWSEKEAKVFVLKADKVPLDVKLFYENNFKYLGTPIPLAEDVNIGGRDNQRTGEIWFEVRYVPQHDDAYRHSANAQPLHTDGSYIPNFPSSTLLACVANAGEGGETTFIDSKDIFAILKKEKPELLDKLLNNKIPHTRSGDFRNENVIRIENEDVFVNWNYYCVDKNIDTNLRETVEEYQRFLLNSPGIEEKTIGVKLQPGDAVFWRDNYVLHGRNSFIANQESERFIWKCAIDIGVFN